MQPASPSRILVVDDISKNLQVVGAVLHHQGYHVMPATSGRQALERIGAQKPDLILLDLMMPEMDGLEVCRRLKSDSATCEIPVIFLTASNELEHLMQGFAEGAVDYVTKPFNTSELLARVRTHLELKHARQRLREMNDEKNEFMGIVAHDLRNPLSAIKGYAEIILEETQSDSPEAAELAQRIQEVARRMTDMVQKLLDANAAERGEFKVELAPHNLARLAQQVADAARPSAEKKQQSLRLGCPDSPLMAALDPGVTIAVLENLISNAIKYSPAGKAIQIRVNANQGAVRCEVADEGPGISAADQQRLFGRFARLTAKPTAGESSTGLGLSIVKRMVEAMNGRVWCESEPGRGATFIVEFEQAGFN